MTRPPRHPRTLTTLVLALGAGGVFAADAQPLFNDPPGGDAQLVDGGLTRDAFPVLVHGHAGWMNQAGQLTVAPTYDWTDDPYDGVARVVVDGFTGYRRCEGGRESWVVEPVLRFGDRFSEGFAVVGDGRRFGFIDATGEQVVGYTYDDARRFAQGLAAVRLRDRCGFIDQRGRVVVPLRYAAVRSFRHGLAAFERPAPRRGTAGVLGYVDTRGVEAFVDNDRAFAALGDFDDTGLAPAQRAADGLWGYLNDDFAWAIEPRFTNARAFVNDLAAVELDGKWGYIGPDGAFVIAAEFDGVSDFSDVLAVVQRGRRFGYIDRDGLTVVAPQFTEAEPFARGLARVWLTNGPGYLDVRGHVVWHPDVAERGYRDLRAASQPNTGSPPRVAIRRPRAIDRAYPPDTEYDPALSATRRRR